MRRLLGLSLTLLLALLTGVGRAGDFDYFVLALSWNPSWCVLTGDDRAAPECADGAGFGFTLHGLWPQHEEGWPEYCESGARDPSRQQTAAMADIMGSSGLAWHQWVKHGRCTGADPAEYFGTARAAFASVDLPETVADAVRTTPAALLAELRAGNPDVPEDGAVVTCREGLAVELRLCLTRELQPRRCGTDVLARSCRADRQLVLPPPR